MAAWDDDFTAGFDAWVQDWQDATPIAVGRGTEVIKAEAASRAPIREGNLRASADVTVHDTGFDAWGQIRFPGPYARRQHYELTWRHPRGGHALYLYLSLHIKGRAAMNAIADAYREIM